MSGQKITPEYPPNLNQTLRFFVDTIFTRARAAFALIRNDCSWEAEIVLRSLYEAHARNILFCVSNDSQTLLREFWIELQSSSDRKAALKADKASEMFEPGSIDRDVFAFLKDPNAFDVHPKANKATRRRLDQKWSFPEVLRSIEEESKEGIAFRGSGGLLHIYGMQSEILHVSSRYYDLLWDRSLRGADLASLAHGHTARQLSDMIWMTAASVCLSLRRLGLNKEEFCKPLHFAEKFSECLKGISESFEQSQRPFYDELLGRG